MKKYKRYTVTSALPYANGPLHIGHIAGAYLPADTYVRFLRLRGEDVIYVGGSDEHGVAITIGAKKEGLSPKEFVDKYHNLMKKAFEDFGISFDIYSRTSNKTHYTTAQDFFLEVYNKDLLIEETSDQYYDEQENIFLADRYIIGTCPSCGNPNAYGDQCEKCGTSLSPKQLINPRSTVSGNTPVLKPTKHWYFPLDKFENWLREWVIEGHKDDWKTNVYGQCKSWIDQGLQPRSITRDLDWGIPVPLPGAEGKVLYVWFDAPIGYISATKELRPSDWQQYWKDPDTRLIHFIGKDNIVFHCIIFPAMLKAHGEFVLPDNVPANEFLNLEGDKLSTSRNHAVWLHEYLRDFPGRRDELRYVLTSISPETKDSDFTWKDYQQKVNSELVAILGNFVNRVMVLTWKYFDGKVPGANALSGSDKRQRVVDLQHQAMTDINGSVRSMIDALEHFRFREAQFHMMNVARTGNKFLADTEPWKLAKDDLDAVAFVLHHALTIVGNLGVAIEPFLPDAAANILKQLNATELHRDWKTLWTKEAFVETVTAGHQLNQPELLYRNVEDDDITKQIERLAKAKSPTTQHASNQASVKPLKSEITIDDFSKLDIRIGKVTAAEKMEKSNKLLKLTVESGVDTRTILSGIAQHYAPEEMVGKNVTFIANLAPRKMMGILSQGMILMAEDSDGKLRLISPDNDVEPGSTVS